MISTSCHTAGNALALEFDATPWFREDDLQSILHLAEQGWFSAWIAEALETRSGDEALHQLVECAATRLRDEALEDPTRPALDCVINPSDAKQFIGVHFPSFDMDRKGLDVLRLLGEIVDRRFRPCIKRIAAGPMRFVHTTAWSRP